MILSCGTDCSGLTQRSITKANKLEIPGVISKVKDLSNFGSCPVDNEDCKPCGDPSIWSQDYMPTYARSIGTAVGKAKTDVLKKVRKGDVVIYPHHVALVHSDELSCGGITKDKQGKDQFECTYEIIHASGEDELCYKPAGTKTKSCNFNRKVVVNNINNELQSKTLKEPSGFGRIKLWD